MTHSKSDAVVGTYFDATSAHCARLRLEADGIQAFVLDENIVTYDPLLAMAVGGVKLVVDQADRERANVLLADRSTELERYCPECCSNEVAESQLGRRLAFLSMLLVALPIGRSKAACRCLRCDHTWRD